MGNDTSAEDAERHASAMRENAREIAEAANEAEKAKLEMEFKMKVAMEESRLAAAKEEREARQEEARMRYAADKAERAAQREADKEEKAEARSERDAERAEAQKRVILQAENAQKQFDALQIEKKEERALMEKEKAAERELKREEAERRAALEKEKQAQLHAQELEKLEQEMKSKTIEDRRAARDECRAKVSSLEEAIDKETDQLNEAKVSLKMTSEDLVVQTKVLTEWEAVSGIKIAAVEVERGLPEAKKQYDDGEEEIKQAIAKTGQQEGNVGRFLHLTHGLVGATLETTTQSNKLEAEMSTFNELISRECSDKLTIKQYFGDNEHLKPLIPILAAKGMSYMETLKCADEKESEVIVQLIESELQKAQDEAQNQPLQVNKRPMDDSDNDEADDEKAEPKSVEELLTEWKLSEFWEKFEEEGYTEVEEAAELKMEDFADMKIKKKGKIKKYLRLMKKFIATLDDDSLMSLPQKRFINQICNNPETWEPFAQARVESSKSGLDVVSGLLADFFSEMNKGVAESQKFITYGASDKTLQSIQAVQNLPPAIEYPTDIAKDDVRWDWKVGTECEIYSKSDNAWMAGKISKIEVTEDDGEFLHAQFDGKDETKRFGRFNNSVRPIVDDKNDDMQLAVQSQALSENALANLNVTNSMMERFKVNPTAERALTVAEGVEGCCQQIVSSQCTIRQSVMLAAQILDMKPAAMTKDTQPLWDAVDSANVHIFETAIDMTRACSQYFGYFLRFKSSFLQYQSKREQPLMISLEHLRNDCEAFAEFRGEFEATVNKLNKAAMACIANCVKSNVGAANYERAMKEREIARSKYIAIKAEVDKEVLELEKAYDIKQHEVVVLMAKEAGFKHKVDTLSASIELREKNKEEYAARELELTGTLNDKADMQ